MSTPQRPRRQGAFDNSSEEHLQAVTEDTEDVLALLTRRTPEVTRLQSVAPLADPPARPVVVANPPAAPAADLTGDGGNQALSSAAAISPVSAPPAAPFVASDAGSPDTDRRAIGAGSRGTRRAGRAAGEASVKPPTAYLSHDVYLRLLEFSDKERKQKRTTARPFGVITMDAIERHADKLESFWKSKSSAAPPPGGLFVRAKSNSRYRRHEQTPRSITLQGVGPENARLLKQLKNRWGAGSVSALVEQALRFELNFPGQ